MFLSSQQIKKLILASLWITSWQCSPICAQNFCVKNTHLSTHFLTLRHNQLFTQLGLGINMTRSRHPGYLYIAAGYGKPNERGAWRKFIPPFDPPQGFTNEQLQILAGKGYRGLHALTYAIGWNQYLGRCISTYCQVGWATVIDLSSPPAEIDLSNLENGTEKKTLLYNTIPIEAGLSVDVWKGLTLQGGLTYYWKEIPLLTGGIAYAF